MRLLRWLFLATLFAVTFEKLHWSFLGDLSLADVLTVCFVAAFVPQWARRGSWRAPSSAAIVVAFFAVFLLVYLTGFFNLETKDALNLWTKGLVKFVLHFALLGCGLVYLQQASLRFYFRALAAFVLGMAANAVYGVLQLGFALTGGNLDQLLLAPLTGGASSINIYGAVNGQSVFRPNALTGDPNHLGIMLVLPLLVLTPLYLRVERRHRVRRPLALLLAFLLVVELATLSRSGMLGLATGLLILVVPYRRRFRSPRLLAPLTGVAVVVGAIVWSRWSFFGVVLRSRLQTSGGSENAHIAVYGFIPQVLHAHPLLGLGLNTFSVYYAFVTGKTNWGPHSFYVALFVETGLIGTLVFAVFLWYVFARLGHARALGRALASAGNPLAARLRPLAWGFTAALAGTMAANAFYLTMSFYYFYCFILLGLALPRVFARAAAAERRPVTSARVGPPVAAAAHAPAAG